MVGFRDNWQNQLGVSYTDHDGNNIEGSIIILTKMLATSNPVIVEFINEQNNVSEFKFFYGGHYDDFNGGRHALFNNSKTISQTTDGGSYATIYRMYYYPATVTPGNPMPTPSGFNKYTIVSNGEIQFFKNSTQICVIDDGNFPGGDVMKGKQIKGNGIAPGTVIGSYSFGPSKFSGSYPKTIYIDLSTTVDVLTSDGYFFIQNPPPPNQISNVSFSNMVWRRWC
jgi:hypothetical protein